MANRIKLSVDSTKPFVKGVKIIAATEDKSMREVVHEALTDKHPELLQVKHDHQDQANG